MLSAEAASPLMSAVTVVVVPEASVLSTVFVVSLLALVISVVVTPEASVLSTTVDNVVPKHLLAATVPSDEVVSDVTSPVVASVLSITVVASPLAFVATVVTPKFRASTTVMFHVVFVLRCCNTRSISAFTTVVVSLFVFVVCVVTVPSLDVVSTIISCIISAFYYSCFTTCVCCL